jgi:hypothetical protein
MTSYALPKTNLTEEDAIRARFAATQPDRAAFEHLVVMAHNACRTLDYPVALQNAITNAEKELAKWK